ncbi:MAG: sulfatase-like hydrolase/transferase, partial [Candidatus Brocadiia bacterium]
FAPLLEDLPSRPAVRKNWGEREWRLHRWAYHRLTERVDRQIGVLLDALELSGQAEDTVIIFTSDHGDLDGAHRMEQKHFFYDECYRVPLIVAWPGHHGEGEVDEEHLCQTGLDLMTTCCSYAGIERPDYNPGLSWRALLEGRADEWRDEVYGENPIGTCLVTDRYKYCHYTACGEEEQLFDLAADPGEMHSLHADPQYRSVLEQHRAVLGEKREAHLALQVYCEEEG